MICTFYSYKGGVGRSMALANIAEVLVGRGLRVLMIDWDLEGPGLESYFPLGADSILQQRGVVDMILDCKTFLTTPDMIEDGKPNPSLPDLRSYRCAVRGGGANGQRHGELWLMPAGRRYGKDLERYERFVRTFDWLEFYQEWEGESFLEWFRRQTSESFDAVLIDTPTGMNRLGGICTYQLADTVVMFCGHNAQNLNGTASMAAGFLDPDVRSLRADRPLRVLVVPSRIEDRAERRELLAFREDFMDRFGAHRFSGDRALAVPATAMWDLAIPNVSFYAFREAVAVRDPNSEGTDLYEAYHRLADTLGTLPGVDWPADFRTARRLPYVRRHEEPSLRIPAYLSHSYRSEDRELNVRVWERFWDAGFTFAVDPKLSGPLSIPCLELIMRQSACFVAIAPVRSDQERYRTSPYIVFEHNMAVRAAKPRLVIAEPGVAGFAFGGSSNRLAVLGHDDLAVTAELDRLMERLWEESMPDAHASRRLLGSAGVILPSDSKHDVVRARIGSMLTAVGYPVEMISSDWVTPTDLSRLEEHDFVLIDIGALETTVELYNRFVPTIRIAHRGASARYAPLPHLLRDEALERTGEDSEGVIWWEDADDLMTQLEGQVAQMQRARHHLGSLEEGIGYFRSLGRSVSGPVFVSSAPEQREIAELLCRALDLNNVPFFHYRYRNTIPLGSRWPDQLLERVRSSQLFIAIVTRDYLESDSCRQEFALASRLAEDRRLHIYPYFLEDVPGDDLTRQIQGRLLDHLTAESRVSAIVNDIDRFLTVGQPV